MSKISTYEVAPVPKLSDKLIGTSVGGEIEDVTYNFTLQELLDVFLPVIPANNLQGILDYGNTATQDINLFGTITTTNLDVTDTANLFITYLNEETHVVGSLFDSADSVGTAGQVLTSTGDGVEWFTLPPIFTPNLQQVLEEGNTADLDIILDANLEALDVSADTATVGVNLTLGGTITDNNSSVGSAGQVLESTVTGVQWTNLPVYSATSPLLFNSGTNTFSIQVANSTQGGYLTASDWVTFDGKQNAGAYITALTGEATATGPGSVPITLNNASVIAKVLTGLNVTGGSISASDSILTAFGKVQSQINGLMGGVQYQGVWNASTNTPTLTSSVGTQGHYYIVNVAGTTNLNGITDWQIGDWAIFSGGAWQKVDNTESVTSVNGQTGAVSLTTDNIPEGATNLYYLDSRARGALSFAAGSGAYNSLTGVITIPTNNNQILNGANYITLGSLSASSPLVYNNLTGAFSIPQATSLVDGYLSATDWSTFNNKQNYLGGTGLVKSTAGTITYITDNSSNWNTAYNRSIVSASVTGTTTKTLTLNEQDGNTIQASWTDLDTGLTSVGVSMPAAFSVANSPLTSNGTIAITGAGTTLQYIDGTGALQTFPGLTGFVPYTGATQNVDLGEYGISAGYFQADLTPTGALQVGRMQWNSTDGTMDLRLMGNNVTLQIGQENVTRVVNKSGIDLLEANYQVVRVRKVAEGGAQGQRLAVVLAQGNNENNSTEVLGLVTETINANQEGFVTAFGEVKNINTTGSLQGETWVDGDILYLSSTVAGQLTNVRPVAPNHAVIVGYVTYAHANNGKIYMAIDTGYELGELHNVYAPSPTNNQSIYWNSTNSRYQLNTIGGILGYTPANAATLISTTAPLQGGGDLSANRTFSITQAGASTDGYLSSTDWNTFNNKQPAGSYVPTSRLLSINGTQYDLSADRSWSVGTVTSVAALTLGTSGTDLSSSVANGTTTPVITLNVPTASAANRGVLSAADWSTFNTKVGGVTASSPLASSGGQTPNITIQQASGSQDGFLSSTDWTTFNNKQAAGNYITSLTGEATASGPGAAAVTLNNASVTAKVLTGVNITGGSISATDTMLTAFGKLQNQINGLIGSTIYQGTWNAATNTPALTSGVGTRGYYYIVSVAGNTNLDGITDWFVGDWAIFDGTAWQQVDNTDAVVSVNGQTGAVSLTTDNIPEGATNQYFTQSRARASLSFAAGSGAYNSTSGLITIPTNTNQLTNGASFITLASLSGTAPIVYSNTTGAISITQSGTASNGYLSSTDWNTFNNKQSALTNPVTGTGTTNYLPKFTGTSTIGNSLVQDNGSTVSIITGSTVLSLDRTGGATALIELKTGGTVRSYLGADTSMPFVFFNQAASPLMYLDASGNLGLGTSSPSVKLQVVGDGSFSGYVNANVYNLAGLTGGGALSWTTNTLRLGQDSYFQTLQFWTNGSDRMRLDASGNLGLGVTPSAWNTVTAFQVGSTSLGGYSNTGYVNSNAFYQTGWKYVNSSFAARYEINSGDAGIHAWFIAPSGTAGNAISFTQAMTLDASGRLGIGTTSPAYKLDVAGSFNFTTGGNYLTYNSGILYHGNYYQYPSGNNYLLFARASGALILGTNDTESMRITTGNNVGIGTVSPQARLQVSNSTSDGIIVSTTTNVEPFIAFWRNSASNGVGVLRLIDGGNLYFDNGATGAAQSTKMILNASGNLGLGVTPSAWSGFTALQVGNAATWSTGTNNSHWSSNTYYDGTNRIYIGSDYATEYAQQSGAHKWFIAASGTAGGTISTTQAMTLTSGGNLGIGITSPTAKLEVYGSAESSPSYTTGGIFRVNSTATNALIFGTLSGSPFAGYIQSGGSNKYPLSLNPEGGNVGIGTTAPSYKLQSNASSYQLALINPGYGGWLYNVGTDLSMGFVLEGTGEKMRLTSSGDLLIGDTTASANLWVKSSAPGNTFGARNTNATFAATVGFFGADRNTSNNSFYYIDCYNYGSGTYRFRVADSGEVTSAGSITASNSISILGSNGGGKKLYFTGGTTKYNFMIAAQENVDNTLEITPSSAAGGSTFSTPAIVVTGTGLVGIGTTGPSYKLQVNGTNGSIAVSGSGYTLNPIPMLIGQYSSTRGYIQVPNQGSFEIWNGGTSAIAEFKNNSQSIFNGSVGIGTQSPAKALDVYSSATTNTAQIVASDAGSTNRLYMGTFSNGGYITFGGTYQSGWSANGSNAIADINFSATSGASSIQFSTSTSNGVGPSERMRITSGGNVGIGTTSPVTRLNLSGSSTQYITLTNGGADGVPNAVQGGIIGQARSSNNNLAQMASILFRNQNSAAWYVGEITFNTNGTDGTNPSVTPTERMRINADGLVGIGTTTPTSILDASLSGGSTSGFRFKGWSDAGTPYLLSLGTQTYQDIFQIKSVNGLVTMGIVGAVGTTPDLAFQTNSTERMRITSGGDININMPNSTNRYLSWYSANGVYQVAAVSSITDPSYNDAGYLIFSTAKTSSGGFTEKMRITPNGNVGIANTNPTVPLDIAAGASGIRIRGGSSTSYLHFNTDGSTNNYGSIEVNNDASSGTSMRFYNLTSGILTEKMRLTSGGALCLGTTSAYGTNLLNINGSVYATGQMAAVISSDVDMFTFVNTGASYTKSCFVGSIAAAGSTSSYYFYGQQSTSVVSLKIFTNGNIQNTNNSYGAISDARLKENIIDATPKLEDLMKVKVRNYNLKGESNKQIGVISQELEQIFPNMIEESTNLGENVKIKGVKYSVFVPMLIKAIQEQQEQINYLKSKIQ